MKSSRFSLPELIHNLSFLLYLGGSSLALFQNGIELSLWLMAFAVIVSSMTTLLPWLGFRWLKIPNRGSRFWKGAALFLQICSWGTYAAAMVFRLYRDLHRFQVLITVTTLLWASWLLLFIYSRYAFQPSSSGDKLSPAPQKEPTGQEKVEE